MYTEKELKFLKVLFKFLDGEHKEYIELKNYIKDRFHLSEKISFEMAYLYDKNWSEEGFNKDQEDVERMSYEEYKEKIPWQVKAVISVTQDENPDNYEFDGYEEVEHDGTTYRIYESEDDIITTAESLDILDDMCRDSETQPEYVYITDTDRRIIADEESHNRVDNMDDDDIISEMDLEDTLEELESYNENKEKLKELEDELASEEDEEEINRIQSEIDEIESEINNIGVTQTREEIIENAKDELISTYYDQIYDELSDPVQYFVEDHGYYANVEELVENGPVQYDCEEWKNDYLGNADMENIVYAAGYANWEELEIYDPNLGNKHIFVLWY